MSIILDSNDNSKSNIIEHNNNFKISVNKTLEHPENSTSCIRLKETGDNGNNISNDKEDNMFNFLEQVGIDPDNSKPENNDDCERHTGSHLRIHKKMEYTMGHYYNDDGLTIVSEEQSKQFTEYNFKRGQYDLNSSKTQYSKSNSKKSGLNSDFLGKSIDDAVYMNRFKQGSGGPTKNSQQSPNKFMTQQATELNLLTRKISLDKNHNSKSDHKLRQSNGNKNFENVRNSLDKKKVTFLPIIKSRRC